MLVTNRCSTGSSSSAFGAFDALAAAALGAVDARRRALDVAVVRDRDDHRLFFDEVFEVDVADLFAAELGAALVGVLAGELLAIVADDGVDSRLRRPGCARYSPISLEQLGVLVDELFLLEIDELAERHLQDRVGLHGRERIFLGDAALLLELGEADVAERPLQQGGRRLDLHQPLFGLGLRLRGADHADHFVDVGVGEQQALHGVLALAARGTAGTASAGGSRSRDAARTPAASP